MTAKISVGLILFLSIFGYIQAAPAKTNGIKDEDYWRVCYYTNWAQYRPPGGTFLPENIDVNLCSHLIYAFADMYENHLVFYEYNDEEMYARFNLMKLLKPELKTLLAVGGWTFGTSKMTLMLSSPENRTDFINSSISYLRHYRFDGFDLDFEYPANRGSPPEDKYLFTLLCEELRQAFNLEGLVTGREPLLLTVGVAAGKSIVDTAYEIDRIAAVVDKINLMSYDLNGAFTNDTGINAPLFSDTTSGDPEDLLKSVSFAADYWVAGGCPRKKLLLGMATYGRGFTLAGSDNSISAPAKGPSKPLNFTLSEGFIAWYEMCRYIEPIATLEWSEEQRVPYAYHDDQWYGYDNVQSLEEKVAWLKDGGFGGWMVWSLDYDDFNGDFCGEAYPLLRTLNRALLGYVPGDTTQSPGLPAPDPDFCKNNDLSNGYHPDPATCTRFYSCRLGTYTDVFTCSPGTIFDPEIERCEWPQNVDQDYTCNNCEPEFCIDGKKKIIYG